MTEIVGGLRQRLIFDSLFNHVKTGLQALHWLDTNRDHAPVHVNAGPVDFASEVKSNTLTLSDEDLHEEDGELGSTLVETTQVFYWDFYAENDAIGKHLAHDIRDLLQGRMPSIGYAGSQMPVLDWRQATPPVLFHVDITGVEVDRPLDYPKPWMRHWRMIRLQVIDSYTSDQTG